MYNMRVLVFSDTHGNHPLLFQAISCIGPVDLVIHLGDEVEDARQIEYATGWSVLKVAGNCDPPSNEPRELILTLCGTPCLLTHGDRHQVKRGLEPLLRQAQSVGASVVLYGHTHQATILEAEGILFVNPGTLARGTATCTCALVTFTAVGCSAVIVDVEVPPTPPIP